MDYEIGFFDLDTRRMEPADNLRLRSWETVTALIRDRPLLGYGVGGFAYAYAKERPIQTGDVPLQGWCGMPAYDTHNQFLMVTIEAGCLGLAVFPGFIVGAMRQRARDPYRYMELSVLAASCVTSLFNSHFKMFAESHFIALPLGVLLAAESVHPVPGLTNRVNPIENVLAVGPIVSTDFAASRVRTAAAIGTRRTA